MQGQGWRSLGFGDTPLCVSALLVVVPLTQQRPLQLSDEQRKKQGGDVKEHKLSGIRDLSCGRVGRRRSGGREGSWGGAHSSRNSRQKKPGWISRLCPAPPPLFFPKTQGENNSLLKSTNLLGAKLGEPPTPHTGKQSRCVLPEQGQPAPAAPPAPTPRVCGFPASSGRPNPILGTETCPGSKTRSALNVKRGAGRVGAEPECVGAGVCVCGGVSPAQTQRRSN